LNATNAGLANLHALVFREALVMTFSDTFYVLAMCFAVGIVSVIFVRPIGAAPPSPDAH
ncbi:MAG: transporter, family, multidrug resistance protein, partial [Caballeronia mineralivorans]|nr:transporter, family, multidrug resistance protein [Caballeronia mineralivorans]